MIEGDMRRKLERFEASVENRTADGPLLEELVEQCAPDVSDWEVSDCWPLRDYPGLSAKLHHGSKGQNSWDGSDGPTR